MKTLCVLARVAVAASASVAALGAALAQSGEVNVYTYREGKLIQPLFDAFTKASGVKVNVTALFTTAQVELITEAVSDGAPSYISVFAGRIADAGIDPVPIMARAVDIMVEPEYKERPFVGAGLRMQVSLEPAWLEPVWQMFVGVQSPLTTEENIRLLTKAGQLDMKIGSSEKVDRIFQMGAMGLKFTHMPTPPRALPNVTGLVYFQVSRDSEEWENVRKSLTLAIRLNELKIAGNIQGQRILTIQRADGQSTTMEFTLYVVKGA